MVELVHIRTPFPKRSRNLVVRRTRTVIPSPLLPRKPCLTTKHSASIASVSRQSVLSQRDVSAVVVILARSRSILDLWEAFAIAVNRSQFGG